MRTLLPIIILFLITFNATAQDKPKEDDYGFWLEGGVGLHSQTSTLALGKSTWFTISNKNTMYKFRHQYLEELFGTGTPHEYTRSFALMIGKKKDNKIVHVGASIGLGISKGVYQGEYLYSSGWFFNTQHYERKTFNVLSLPMELDVVFKPIPVLGFGFAVTSDLNPKNSSLGFLLKIGIGKF